MIEFLIFGLVDNGVMLLGALFGLEIEHLLPKKYFSTGMGAVVGAGIGNATSDFLGGVFAGNMQLAVGTGVGCLLALVAIPLINYIKRTT